MFFPGQVNRVTIVTLKENEQDLFRFLGNLSQIHLYSACTEKLCFHDPLFEKEQKRVTELQQKLLELLKILNLENTDISAYTQNDTSEGDDLCFIDILNEEALKIVSEISHLEEHNNNLSENIQKLQQISGINLDIKRFSALEYLFFRIGIITYTGLKTLQNTLSERNVLIMRLASFKDYCAVAVISEKEDSDELDLFLKNCFFTPAGFPEEYSGTPVEMARKLAFLIEENQDRISTLCAKIDRIRNENRDKLFQSEKRLFISRYFFESRTKFGYTDQTVIAMGFVPSDGIDEFQRKFENDFKYPFVIETEKASGDDVPVVLENPEYVRRYEIITDTFGHPGKNEIDPTPVISLTFPLMFGMMFGDVGQGAVLALCGYIAGKKLTGKPGKDIASIAAYCGISAAVFGFLYGSVFGFEHLLRPVLFSPLENLQSFFVLAIIFGVMQLSLGMLLAVSVNLLRKDFYHAIFDKSGAVILLFYLLVIMSVYGSVERIRVLSEIGIPSTCILLILFIFRDFVFSLISMKPDFHMFSPHYIFESLLEIYEVVLGLLSNTVSFIRIAAFAMVHAALMGVIFTLADMISHAAGQTVVIIAGNILVLIMEGAIVSIQTVRLEYYEFFSKFYHGSGDRFKPLSFNKEEK